MSKNQALSAWAEKYAIGPAALEALQGTLANQQETVSLAADWLEAALNCKHFTWCGDQRAAAEETLRAVREGTTTPTLIVIDPDHWVPCSPEYLENGGICDGLQVWNAKTCNHWHPKNITEAAVFLRLLGVMQADSDCEFFASATDYQKAKPAIQQLIVSGYFQGAVDDLDGDYWQCAAGERDEAVAHFARAPEAYAALDAVLNDIFDRPAGDTP